MQLQDVKLIEPKCEVAECQTSCVNLPDDPGYAKAISILPLITQDELVTAQKNDPDIGPVLKALSESENKPNDIPIFSICRTAERNLLEMMENKNLPEQYKEQNGVLM